MISDSIEPRVCELGMRNSRPQVKGNEDSGNEAVDCQNCKKPMKCLLSVNNRASRCMFCTVSKHDKLESLTFV